MVVESLSFDPDSFLTSGNELEEELWEDLGVRLKLDFGFFLAKSLKRSPRMLSWNLNWT